MDSDLFEADAAALDLLDLFEADAAALGLLGLFEADAAALCLFVATDATMREESLSLDSKSEIFFFFSFAASFLTAADLEAGFVVVDFAAGLPLEAAGAAFDCCNRATAALCSGVRLCLLKSLTSMVCLYVLPHPGKRQIDRLETRRGGGYTGGMLTISRILYRLLSWHTSMSRITSTAACLTSGMITSGSIVRGALTSTRRWFKNCWERSTFLVNLQNAVSVARH